MIPIVCLMMAATADLSALTKQVATSGQVLELGVTPSERVAPARLIAPGQPPLLTLDDAGH